MLTTARPRPPSVTALACEGDVVLARRVGRGDAAAFETLFARYHDPLHRYCRALVRHEHDAEDAFQATMIRAYRALRRGGEDVAVRPWLYRIAHNECMRVMGGRAGHSELSGRERAREALPAERAEMRETLEHLRSDLLSLPDAQREALVLREMSGLSHAEIAATLSTSPESTKHLLREARLSLAECAAGRTLPCPEVRERIAGRDGRALRARAVRSHLRACGGCREFREAVGDRPRRLAALFPAVPVAAAQRSLGEVLAAFGGAGASGGAVVVAGAGGGAKGALAIVSTAVVVAAAAAVAPVVSGHAPGAGGGPAQEAAGGLPATAPVAAATPVVPPGASLQPARAAARVADRASAAATAPVPPGERAAAEVSAGAPATGAAPAATVPAADAPSAPAPVRGGEGEPGYPAAPSAGAAARPAAGASASVAVPLPGAAVGADATVSVGPAGAQVGLDATVQTPIAPVRASVDLTVGGDSTVMATVGLIPGVPVTVTLPRLLGGPPR